jgi:nicotinamidase-related amidase/type 1 glutamine amidotransferase
MLFSSGTRIMATRPAIYRLLVHAAAWTIAVLATSPQLVITAQTSQRSGEPWELRLRYREEASPQSGRFHVLSRTESWDPRRTAIIVCDVWDSHHSYNAAQRVAEVAPRIDALLVNARRAGATIVHSPSDCMRAYEQHPARLRALAVPLATHVPPQLSDWCSRIASELSAQYPIDQSDGGDDDDPESHARWVAELRAQGRVVGTPWQRQTPLIAIDEQTDFISDQGVEVWNILESRNIDNVILCGVHTNMCVLGRPFGLRNMVAAGKRVALIRDLTDTMYNPRRWPFVNHHTGTDLVVEYIERFVCPTLTSDQLLGGEPFRFKSDDRPLLAIVMAEDEYRTETTLPAFAARYLSTDFRVELIFASDRDPNDIPGLEILEDADAAIISVRRRPLPRRQMDIVRRFVASGKPLIGVRTASHAFALRDQAVPDKLVAWPEFDQEVWGGNYSGHHPNEALPSIQIVASNAAHPILRGVVTESFLSGGSLYKTSPLAPDTTAILTGTIDGQPAEPVAWTFQRPNNGRSFYTSLGHERDFDHPAFVRLLFNGICWASNLEDRSLPQRDALEDVTAFWRPVLVPPQAEGLAVASPVSSNADKWYRCFFKLPPSKQGDSVWLRLHGAVGLSAWVNGKQVKLAADPDGNGVGEIPVAYLEPGELNVLVVRCKGDAAGQVLSEGPAIGVNGLFFNLTGRWQYRVGLDPSLAALPLPAKFGASPDAVFDFADAQQR